MATPESDLMDAESLAVSVVERVKTMTLEEVAALLAKGGRATEVLPPAEGAGANAPRRVRRAKTRTVIDPADGVLTLTLTQLLLAACALPALLAALFLLWWRPHLGSLGGGAAAGLLGGVGLAWLYRANVKRKQEASQLLSMDPGLKGCQYLLGGVPFWIALTDREKMEWFNKLLHELWPFYDRGICKTVKEVVEPIMEMYRPPGIIKRIFFQELTFGNAPFRVEGIHVRELEDEIDMEVDVRWSGDANICLGIDLPVGGELTRLNPKVTDIVFVATFKVILKPLVRKIPGFAAAAAALKGPPIINYRLNFGSLSGGSVTTAPITAFVNFIVKEVLVGMLVWPKRITVPILSSNGFLPANDPNIDLEVERLAGRVRGVVRVEVIKAKGLKSYDTLTGKSNPMVDVFTTPNFRYSTRYISNNLEPVWEEVFHLPVLEKDQILHIEVFDHDMVNMEGVAKLQIWKGIADSVGAKEFMGRCAVKLAPLIADEGNEGEEMWFPLGRGEWTNPQGTGKGEGLIRLGLSYRPLEKLQPQGAGGTQKGLLLVSILGAKGLNSARGDKMSSYVKVKVGKQDAKTYVAYNRSSPTWSSDNKFTFYDVTPGDDITIAAMEPALAMDEELGHLKLKAADVVQHSGVSRWTGQEQAGYVRRTMPLQGGRGGTLDVEIEWLPHW